MRPNNQSSATTPLWHRNFDCLWWFEFISTTCVIVCGHHVQFARMWISLKFWNSWFLFRQIISPEMRIFEQFFGKFSFQTCYISYNLSESGYDQSELFEAFNSLWRHLYAVKFLICSGLFGADHKINLKMPKACVYGYKIM